LLYLARPSPTSKTLAVMKTNKLKSMTIEQVQKNASYLFYCKEFYFTGIKPTDFISNKNNGYKILIEIAQLYFEKNLLEEFATYLMEGQYFIQLWTAHLILEYGNPDEKLKELCLNEIKNYSDNPLAPEVAIQEEKWLKEYYEKVNGNK
jgi:hypothetical protein